MNYLETLGKVSCCERPMLTLMSKSFRSIRLSKLAVSNPDEAQIYQHGYPVICGDGMYNIVGIRVFDSLERKVSG